MIFPLPLEFFPPLQLSTKEKDAFLQWGHLLIQQTIDAYHREQFDTTEIREKTWKPIKKRHDLTVYRRRKAKETLSFEYKYLCTGRINGTLDEVVMGRYADNTPDFRRISSIYREDLVDCAVLGVIKKRTPDDPFFLSCFKWMTVESPGKGLVRNRDVCWYEQIGMTRDCNGKEIGYTLTESVELPTCPLFNECVRAKFSICYLYKRNKSGGVKVYMRGKNDAGEKVADWVADLKSAELWLRIEQAMPVAHAVIATALVKAGKNMERSKITPGTCDVCQARTSGFLSSPKQCAVCHCFTCSSCVSKVRVLNDHNFRVPQHELFCKKCVRLIHQMDLRAPENVRNPIEYAAVSLAGLAGLKTSFSSARGASCCTDDSEGFDEERGQHGLSVTSSSSSGSFHSLPQPAIGVKSQNHDKKASYFVYSRGSCPVPEHPNKPTRTIRVKSTPSSMSGVTFSDKPQSLQTTSHRMNAHPEQRRHSHSPLYSTDIQHYAGRDSETPCFKLMPDKHNRYLSW